MAINVGEEKHDRRQSDTNVVMLANKIGQHTEKLHGFDEKADGLNERLDKLCDVIEKQCDSCNAVKEVGKVKKWIAGLSIVFFLHLAGVITTVDDFTNLFVGLVKRTLRL